MWREIEPRLRTESVLLEAASAHMNRGHANGTELAPRYFLLADNRASLHYGQITRATGRESGLLGQRSGLRQQESADAVT